MAMFSNAKVGDRIYSYKWNEFGKITKRVGDFQWWHAQLDSGKTISFDCCGRELSEWQPTVFWNKIQFEIPKKPFNLRTEYKKLKRKEFRYGEGEENYEMWFDYFDSEWKNEDRADTKAIGSYYYEEYFINEFTELLNDNKVTFEQLEQVIKEVENEKSL